jgi:hypothetical protein
MLAYRRLISTGDSVAMCGAGHIAAYGNCTASTFARLDVQGVPTALSPAHAGLSFRLIVTKRDAYNQTIVTDSASVVQLYAASADLDVLGTTISRLQAGAAVFTVAVKPRFAQVDTALRTAVVPDGGALIYLHCTDSATSDKALVVTMRSAVLDVTFAQGETVCPRGYVLSLDSGPGTIARKGACVLCGVGTYSINPLASETPNGSNPSCIPCPLQAIRRGDCERGGPEVNFSLGTWIAVSGVYRLIGCPAGYQLVNSVSGSFANQIQGCQQCAATEYILDSTNPAYTCQPCPLFAVCNGSSFNSTLSGAVWAEVAGRYVLTGCPPGYELRVDAQNCAACPPAFYCPGDATQRIACPQGTFSPAQAAASTACLRAVFVHFAASVPIPVDVFTVDEQRSFRLAVAAASGVDVDRVLVDSFTAYRRRAAAAANGVVVSTKIAADDETQAERVAASLDEATLNAAMASHGLPRGSLSAVRVGDVGGAVVSSRELSAGATAGIAIGALGLMALLGVLGLLLLSRRRKLESAEEQALRIKV